MAKMFELRRATLHGTVRILLVTCRLRVPKGALSGLVGPTETGWEDSDGSDGSDGSEGRRAGADRARTKTWKARTPKGKNRE